MSKICCLAGIRGALAQENWLFVHRNIIEETLALLLSFECCLRFCKFLLFNLVIENIWSRKYQVCLPTARISGWQSPFKKPKFSYKTFTNWFDRYGLIRYLITVSKTCINESRVDPFQVNDVSHWIKSPPMCICWLFSVKCLRKSETDQVLPKQRVLREWHTSKTTLVCVH